MENEARKTKQVSLEQYIKHYGYTKEEFAACADELCKNGVAKGYYQDYELLSIVMGWLFNYSSIVWMSQGGNNGKQN